LPGARVELRDWNEMVLRNRVPAAPRRADADTVAAAEPREIRADGEHFLVGRCRRRLRIAPGRVLAPEEAVDDAVGERDQAGRAVVVLGEHAGDADERERALAL